MTNSDPDLDRLRGFLESSDPSTTSGQEALFGELAVKRGFVSEAQLQECLEEQRQVRKEGQNVRLGQILLKKGHLTLSQFLDVLQLQQQYVLVCSKCGKIYNISGHTAQVALLCLRCGEKLKVPQDEDSLVEARERVTPYQAPAYRPGEMYLGRYRLIREVARGGMGVVYQAEDPDLKRLVALKMLKEGEGGGRVVRRLQREAALAARLRHSNIITIYEVGAVRDPAGMLVHYICMDYIDGQTLAETLKEGKFSEREVVRVLEQVARAVHYAHNEGIIHRDLKPANILIDKSGRPVVTDFGLAKLEGDDSRLTRSGSVMGTPLYMAPEQVEGRLDAVDRRTDVYGLGVTLYEALTGNAPHRGSTAIEIYRKIVEEEPTRPKRWNTRIPADLETIVLRAMAKDRTHRYATAEELAEDLRRYLAGEAISARRPSSWARWKGQFRRRKAQFLLGAVAVVLAFLGMAAYWKLKQSESEWERENRLQAWVTDAKAAYEAGEAEKARGWIRRVLDENPDHAGARYWSERLSLREYQILRGVPETRIVDGLVEVLPLRPERPEEKALRPWRTADPLMRGILALWDGKIQEAEASLQEAVGWEADFYRGVIHYLKGDFGAAVEFAGRYRDKDPKLVAPVWIRMSLACGLDARLRGKDPRKYFDSAEAACTRLEEIDPQESRVLQSLVSVQRAMEDLERGRDPEGLIREALLRLEGIDTVGAAQIRGDLLLARAEFRAGRGRVDMENWTEFEEALEAYTTAIQKEPSATLHRLKAQAHRTLAEWIRKRGVPGFREQWKRVSEEVEISLRLAPGNIDALLLQADATYHLSPKVDGMNAWVSAAELWVQNIEQALKNNPGYAPGWVAAGRARSELGVYQARAGLDPTEALEGALRDFAQAIRINPNFVAAWIGQGQAQESWGGFRQSQDVSPEKDYQGAIRSFDRAIEINASCTEALLVRGLVRQNWAVYVRRKGGDPQPIYEEAIRDFTRALEINPADAEAYQLRGMARQNLGFTRMAEGTEKAEEDFRQALIDFDQSLGVDPGYVDALVGVGLVRSNLGALRLRQGRTADAISEYDAAVSFLQRAVAKRPLDGMTWTYLGTSLHEKARLLREGDPGEGKTLLESAVAAYGTALEINPSHYDALEMRGRILHLLGRNAGALEDLERAVKLRPTSKEYLAPLIEKIRGAGTE